MLPHGTLLPATVMPALCCLRTGTGMADDWLGLSPLSDHASEGAFFAPKSIGNSALLARVRRNALAAGEEVGEAAGEGIGEGMEGPAERGEEEAVPVCEDAEGVVTLEESTAGACNWEGCPICACVWEGGLAGDCGGEGPLTEGGLVAAVLTPRAERERKTKERVCARV